MMTLTDLRYAVILAQIKHFGKAAEACHISQPTLSIAINRLESSLGITMFERDRNKLRLTEVGKQIVAQAQRVLDEAARIKEIAADGKSELNAPLKVGAIYTIGPYLFPHLIPKLKKIAPHMPLWVVEDYTANLRLKLLQGELDVIFISLPFSAPGILTQAVYDEPFVVLMSKDHRLSKKAGVRVKDIHAEEILLLNEGHCFRDQVIEACPQCYAAQGGAQKTTEGSSLETLRHMVASGMGITILPSTATQIQFYDSILCTKPFLDHIPQRRVAIAWRSSFTRPKALKALLKALRACQFFDVCLLPS